jgi:hypothetical protein
MLIGAEKLDSFVWHWKIVTRFAAARRTPLENL